MVGLLAGCALLPRTGLREGRPRTFALAVAIPGGVKPTAAQWAALSAAFTNAIGSAGCLLENVNDADEVVHVSFSPDNVDSCKGCATIVAIVQNDRTRASARRNGIDPESDPWHFSLIMEALATSR